MNASSKGPASSSSNRASQRSIRRSQVKKIGRPTPSDALDMLLEGGEILSKTQLPQNNSGREFTRIAITSHGGIGTADTSLTGSCHLLEAVRRSGERVRIVLDYGMFQGKGAELNEIQPFPPSSINYVVQTHGHLDHAGKLPLLITNEKDKFQGDIFCTSPTRQVTLLGLEDSAKISERDYDARFRQFKKLANTLQDAIRIVQSADTGGVIRRSKNGNRLTGTGELPESAGEGERGSRLKNRVHGGSAIHRASPEKVEKCRILLSQHGLYDLQAKKFLKKRLPEVLQAPAKHLYTTDDIKELELYIQTLDYNISHEITEGVQLVFLNAGHIPGSAMALLRFSLEDGDDFSFLYSGDLGRLNGTFHPFGKPLIPPQVRLDALMHETTYGGKVHLEREIAVEELGRRLRDAYTSGKKAFIIPTFAIERCASMLHHVIELRKQEYFDGEIVLDCPLGVKQLAVAAQTAENKNFLENIGDESNYVVYSEDDRPGLAKAKKFRVIITGSGMANGGPILDYLKRFAPNPAFEFAFAGYQAENTLGRQLTVEGKKLVQIEGVPVEVRAKVHQLDGFSAHADERDLFELAQYSARDKIHGVRHKAMQLLLVHGDRDGSTLAYEHYLERRAKEGKRGIPKPQNIIRPGIAQETVLYQSKTHESL